MRNIGIKYYKRGLYNEKQFAMFVRRGYVTEEEFLELTGMEYEEVWAQVELEKEQELEKKKATKA